MSDPISKVYGKSEEGDETVRRESRCSPYLRMPSRLPFMVSDTVRGEEVERILGCITQETSLSQTTTYQLPSRCQIGPRSEWSSESLSKHSLRCSPGRRQAKQGPVSKVSSFLNTPQMSEREALPLVGRKTPVLLRLCAQCLVRLSL